MIRMKVKEIQGVFDDVLHAFRGSEMGPLGEEDVDKATFRHIFQ
jgi:hypothetical protein